MMKITLNIVRVRGRPGWHKHCSSLLLELDSLREENDVTLHVFNSWLVVAVTSHSIEDGKNFLNAVLFGKGEKRLKIS